MLFTTMGHTVGVTGDLFGELLLACESRTSTSRAWRASRPRASPTRRAWRPPRGSLLLDAPAWWQLRDKAIPGRLGGGTTAPSRSSRSGSTTSSSRTRCAPSCSTGSRRPRGASGRSGPRASSRCARRRRATSPERDVTQLPRRRPARARGIAASRPHQWHHRRGGAQRDDEFEAITTTSSTSPARTPTPSTEPSPGVAPSSTAAARCHGEDASGTLYRPQRVPLAEVATDLLYPTPSTRAS